MGISGSVYSRPAKFSTIIADADLDIGGKAILTTNLSLYEGSADYWYIKNKIKTLNKSITGHIFIGYTVIRTDTITENLPGSGVNIEGLLIKDSLIGSSAIPKIASDDLRNSHDAEIHDERVDGSTWLLQKTFTLDYAIKGTLRFKLQAKGENASVNNKVIWAKNSKAADLGVEFVPANVNYQADSQDVDVGVMAKGETIEIWTQTDDWVGIYVKECRIYYADGSLGAVGMTNS